MAPGVEATIFAAVPEESCSWGLKVSGTLVSPSTAASKVARVPEPDARLITVIAASAPPTSFQLVTSPVKIDFSWSIVRSSTVTSLLTIGPMPTMQTLLSAIFSRSAVSFTFASANTSELPICTAPWVICVMPWPEPPP